MVLARELHKDGNPHFHLYLKFREVLKVTDPNYFDMRIFNDEGDLDYENPNPSLFLTFHGNYQVARSPKNVLQYCTKDGNYIAEGVDPNALRSKKAARNLLLLQTDFKELVDSGELSLQLLPHMIKAKAAYNMLHPPAD